MASLQKVVARPGISAPRAARGSLKVNAIKPQTPYRDELIATVRNSLEKSKRAAESGESERQAVHGDLSCAYPHARSPTVGMSGCANARDA